MRKLSLCLVALFLAVCSAAGQEKTAGGENTMGKSTETTTRRRGPVFRANKEQITQAQALLKQAGHFAGETTGKLDPETRGALKKYQVASGLKETGTLNRITLEKMGIALTEKQKAM